VTRDKRESSMPPLISPFITSLYKYLVQGA
jgi:hypothetical protein